MDDDVTQRDFMRRLFVQHDGNRDAVCREYAAADQAGRVPRASNINNTSAEDYAVALWDDGIKKGWLHA